MRMNLGLYLQYEFSFSNNVNVEFSKHGQGTHSDDIGPWEAAGMEMMITVKEGKNG